VSAHTPQREEPQALEGIVCIEVYVRCTVLCCTALYFGVLVTGDWQLVTHSTWRFVRFWSCALASAMLSLTEGRGASSIFLALPLRLSGL